MELKSYKQRKLYMLENLTVRLTLYKDKVDIETVLIAQHGILPGEYKRKTL